MSLSVFPTAHTRSLQDSGFLRPEILNREAAKERLSATAPGTQEHAQLHSALMKASGIIEICLPHQTYKICAQEDRLLGGFGASEHFFIGDQLSFSELENKTVLYREDVSIKFGHVIALAGDFYGIPNEPISLLGGTDQAKEARFLAAFAALENADPEQIKRLIAEIETEYHEVRHSAAPHHCYSSRLIESNDRFKAIKRDIGELLIDNSDHFFENAQETYLIGHTLACREAAIAGQTQDEARLRRAYALEAFACHFLTDLFAAGHIRNQRGPLEIFLRDKLKFSPEAAKSLSGILTGAQHEYDGERGLEVYTKENPKDVWRAYGDGFFFTPKNAVNQKKAIATVQQSVNEVTKAYDDRSVSATQMMGHIPQAHKYNHEPLYAIREDGQLVIFSDGKTLPIQSKKDYILIAIPLALGVLPEGYINGFIDSYLFPFHIELPLELQNIRDVLSKVISPRIERFTGKLWHIVGIASYDQVRAVAEENSALTLELMGTAKSTYEQGQQILGAVNRLAERVEALHLRFIMAPVRGAVDSIQSSFLKLEGYRQLNAQQLESIELKLWDNASSLMNIFLSVQENAEVFSDRSLLRAYAETQFPESSLEEKKLEATRWFRQILRYQIAAFSTYLNLKYQRGGPAENAIQEIQIFQRRLVDQLHANQESILPDILYSSNSYVNIRQRAIQQQSDFLKFVEKS